MEREVHIAAVPCRFEITLSIAATKRARLLKAQTRLCARYGRLPVAGKRRHTRCCGNRPRDGRVPEAIGDQVEPVRSFNTDRDLAQVLRPPGPHRTRRRIQAHLGGSARFVDLLPLDADAVRASPHL